jgi:precorrin-6A/cobalt-precorrin-6A reductase
VKVLILGGTAEARTLASDLHGREGCRVISSLAGRVGDPALPEGEVRIGGFGGAGGLARYLRDESIDVLVDATHPFALHISAQAAQAADDAGIRLIALRRPGWSVQPGDRWVCVNDVTEAARFAAQLPEDDCVFVTTGRRDLEAYAADGRHAYLIRSIEPPDTALPPHHTIVLDRGPFTLDDEAALMEQHGVAALVTRNSGGEATEAKLAAARQRGIPVIIVDPPAPPVGVEVAADVAAAVALLGFGAR